MANSSSSNNVLIRLVSGVVALSIGVPPVFSAEPTRPFPVLAGVTVPDGRWNDIPALISKLPEMVHEEPLQFQLMASAAEQYFSVGIIDESRKAFQKLLKARKPSPSLFLQQTSSLRIAEIHLLDGQVDEALATLEPLLKDSNHHISQEAMFLKARCLLYKKDWQNLSALTRVMVKNNPAFSNDLAFNLLRAVSAIEQEHYDEALVYLRKYPDEPSALYYQGVAFVKNKEIANALPLYQQILQKDTRFEWVDRLRLVLGESFYENKDLTLADEFLKPVTRPSAAPELRPLALHRRACILFLQKDFTESEKIFYSLLKEYPTHPLRSQWSYLYASIPIFQRDWKQAIKEQKATLEVERGLAPRAHGVDLYQLRLSAEFRILWAYLLLNNYSSVRTLADKFIAKYPKELITSYAYLAKGLALYRMGEYDRALETYQDLLNKYPESSACGKAVYLMTLSLHSARDPFRMASILNEVHNRMAKVDLKGDEWTENTLYWVADAYFQLNDLQNAEKIYKEFVLRAPQSPLVPYALENLGAALSAQGPSRDGEAIVALQQAQLRAQDLGQRELAEQVELELAKVSYNQRDFAKAAATWSHLVQVSTSTTIRAEALFREGEALARQDYYQEAIKRWQTLVRTFKTSNLVPEVMQRIATTQSGLGLWQDSASTYVTLKQSYPNTEWAKESSFQLVQCYFNIGNIPQAVNELLSFSVTYADDARIPKSADNLLSAFHQKKFAISSAQQAALLKLAPGSAGGAALLWEKGASLFNESKYESAQKIFEKIMLSYPNDEYAPLAYFYNADCFFWLQRWDDAANAYQNFFLSFPKHERVPNAMFQKAVCLFRKGSYNEAVDDFQTFLKKFPGHPLAKEAWLNIALAHKKAFELDQAVASYKYVIEKYPDDSKINAVWLQMGSLLEVQGKVAEALRAYSNVQPNSSEYAEALYHMALLNEQRHNVPETRRFLESIVSSVDKKSEYRQSALLKLIDIYEQDGAPASKLRPLYEDVAASSTDPEVAKQAAARLKDLK
jgi:TolA-binding protein